MNLLSVHKFCFHNNFSCHFDANELKIQDISKGRLLYRGLSDNGVYPIYSKLLPKHSSLTHTSSAKATSSPSHSAFSVSRPNKWQLWHFRLGHPSDKVLHSALSFLESFDVLNKTNDVVTHCRHCLNGKMHQLPFNEYTSISTMPLELIHSDV